MKWISCEVVNICFDAQCMDGSSWLGGLFIDGCSVAVAVKFVGGRNEWRESDFTFCLMWCFFELICKHNNENTSTTIFYSVIQTIHL